MAGDDIDDDEYVANLLKQDAQKTAKEYKLVGLDAFRSARPRSGAPKPNTRFLRHIIRETDNHNTALLAKEAEESRARLKRMDRGNGSKTGKQGRLTPPDLTDDERSYRKRKRSNYDDESEKGRAVAKGERRHKTHESQRSRNRHDGSDRCRDGRSSHSSEEGDFHSRSRHPRPSRDRHRESKRRHTKEDSYGARSGREEASRQSKSGRQRSLSAGAQSPPRQHSRHDNYETREDQRRHKERDRYQDKSHREKRSRHDRRRRQRSPDSRSLSPSASRARCHKSSTHLRVPQSRDENCDSRRRQVDPVGTEKRKELSTETQVDDSDSDPLEAIVGPLPPAPAAPVRARGRGAHKVNSTAIDARFSSSYNPANDVQLPSDVEDDWGDALESLRDRQRWKQQGAERLKAAGFTDDQAKKWEKGDEKTDDDVRWAPRGQGREWDRGKVLDEDGHVTLQADWGRLT